MATTACCLVVGLGLDLASGYAHAFILLSAVIVTLPIFLLSLVRYRRLKGIVVGTVVNLLNSSSLISI